MCTGRPNIFAAHLSWHAQAQQQPAAQQKACGDVSQVLRLQLATHALTVTAPVPTDVAKPAILAAAGGADTNGS